MRPELWPMVTQLTVAQLRVTALTVTTQPLQP